jgi:hypothetical protein
MSSSGQVSKQEPRTVIQSYLLKSCGIEIVNTSGRVSFLVLQEDV